MYPFVVAKGKCFHDKAIMFVIPSRVYVLVLCVFLKESTRVSDRESCEREGNGAERFRSNRGATNMSTRKKVSLSCPIVLVEWIFS